MKLKKKVEKWQKRGLKLAKPTLLIDMWKPYREYHKKVMNNPVNKIRWNVERKGGYKITKDNLLQIWKGKLRMSWNEKLIRENEKVNFRRSKCKYTPI